MLERMERLIRDYRMFPQGSTVLCAVSGGADSVCLLWALSQMREKLGIRLIAAHYNHQLRGGESMRDEDFVLEFVHKYCGPRKGADGTVLPPVPVVIGRGDVEEESKRRGTGLEETAREMRYAYLREAAQKAGAERIAVAHTADDNVETVLFHMARGSGLRGIGGIQPVRGELVRPLLTTTRQEVEEFLTKHNLPHVEDSSNGDTEFTRNRLRKLVTPVLEELYPNFATRLAANAARLREDEECLSHLARKQLSKATCTEGEVIIRAEEIANIPDAIAVRVVRGMIAMCNGGDYNCGSSHLTGVVQLCRSDDPSGEMALPYGLTARREYDILHLLPQRQQMPLFPVRMPLPGVCSAGEWNIRCEQVTYDGQPQGPYDFYVSFKLLPMLTIRPREIGDTLKLPGRPTKTVKKWMVEEKIPRYMRNNLPVFSIGRQIAAVAGLGPAQQFVPWWGQQAWHISIMPEKYIRQGETKL